MSAPKSYGAEQWRTILCRMYYALCMRMLREIVSPSLVFVHGPADWIIRKPFTEKVITIDPAGVYHSIEGSINLVSDRVGFRRMHILIHEPACRSGMYSFRPSSRRCRSSF